MYVNDVTIALYILVLLGAVFGTVFVVFITCIVFCMCSVRWRRNRGSDTSTLNTAGKIVMWFNRNDQHEQVLSLKLLDF